MNIGIVIIGRNEGIRLQRCLASVHPSPGPTVYVDSGSKDDSVRLAQHMNVHTVRLDSTRPYTAARARNAGWRFLLDTHPHLDAIQFIDGDCELASTWLTQAARVLESDPRLAVVCGRRRERFRNATIYNRLADMEWDTPVGTAKACGGDALVRTGALVQVGGYRDELICGEEPEMCVRLRAAGWSIQRIDHDCTRHDAAMTRFGQWWHRCVRGGWAYAQGAALHGGAPERHCVRQARSIWTWGLIVPAVVIILAVPSHGLSLLMLPAYLVLMLRIARQRRRGGDDRPDAMLYACFCVLGKFPEMIGQLRFHLTRARGVRAQLIEYKPAPGPAAAGSRS